MGIPNITTNLSGFGCFMEDLLETPEDYGCYIVDRRGQGVEESVNELVSLLCSFMLSFPQSLVIRSSPSLYLPVPPPALGILGFGHSRLCSHIFYPCHITLCPLLPCSHSAFGLVALASLEHC
jgi:hypothetical protein